VLVDVRVDIDRPRDLALIAGDARYQQLYARLRDQLH
jgi:hypothetical protein